MLVNEQPEFFVRTAEVNGNGRYASDYIIRHEATIFNNAANKPRLIIMPLEREDLAALKSDMNIGANFYISNPVRVIEGETLELGENVSYLFLGIPYKRIIDYENDLLKFVVYDTQGKEVSPLYFKRCE